DLCRVVDHFESAIDDAEKLLVILALADAAEQLVEGDGPRRIACVARVERRLGAVARADLEPGERRLLPERRAARFVLATQAELLARDAVRFVILERFGRRAHAFPRVEIVGALR